MMKTSARLRLHLCVLGAALLLAAGTAGAQTAKNPPRERNTTAGANAGNIAPAAVAAAPNARLAALVRAGGTIVRSKGVQGVSHPDVGVYCIRPQAGTGITPGNSIVILTVEYFYSAINEVKVQWAARGSPCGTDRFAVYTLADFNGDGIYGFSSDVGFSIVVP